MFFDEALDSGFFITSSELRRRDGFFPESAIHDLIFKRYGIEVVPQLFFRFSGSDFPRLFSLNHDLRLVHCKMSPLSRLWVATRTYVPELYPSPFPTPKVVFPPCFWSLL